MATRYFTYHTGHFPNNVAYCEVTDKNEYFSHMDDGTTRQNNDELALFQNRLAGCLGYVESGMWIEITDIDLFRAGLFVRDVPGTKPDAWVGAW